MSQFFVVLRHAALCPTKRLVMLVVALPPSEKMTKVDRIRRVLLHSYLS